MVTDNLPIELYNVSSLTSTVRKRPYEICCDTSSPLWSFVQKRTGGLQQRLQPGLCLGVHGAEVGAVGCAGQQELRGRLQHGVVQVFLIQYERLNLRGNEIPVSATNRECRATASCRVLQWVVRPK